MTRIYIHSNELPISIKTKNEFTSLLSENSDFDVKKEYDSSVELIACIGGDGSFLKMIHELDFPSCPIIGINTGHLGFFQELTPMQLEEFIQSYAQNNFTLQEVKPIEATINLGSDETKLYGLNEVLIRGSYSHLTHFTVTIEDTLIQNFSGDGILVSTPVGSTAYNYSLGGALVAPDLEAFQLTPIAPMSSNAYRCFRTGIMLPATQTVKIVPKNSELHPNLILSYDGITEEMKNIKSIKLRQSNKVIRLIRFKTYDYWAKLKTKLL